MEARDTWLLPQTLNLEGGLLPDHHVAATRVAVEVEDEDCPLRQSAKSDKKTKIAQETRRGDDEKILDNQHEVLGVYKDHRAPEPNRRPGPPDAQALGAAPGAGPWLLGLLPT